MEAYQSDLVVYETWLREEAYAKATCTLMPLGLVITLIVALSWLITSFLAP
jgi:hypothetical protein